MTETELELLRLRLRLEAHQVVLCRLYVALANSAPAGAQASRQHLAALRRRYSTIAARRLTPALSDLVSAEYQEALDDLLSDVEEALPPG